MKREQIRRGLLSSERGQLHGNGASRELAAFAGKELAREIGKSPFSGIQRRDIYNSS